MEANSKPIAIITGASSGVSLCGGKALIKRGWHVVLVCQNGKKAQEAARWLNFPEHSFEIMHLYWGSLECVRRFAKELKTTNRALDLLICNAATYMPLSKQPYRSPEGYEIRVAMNYLGHILLCHLLIPNLNVAKVARLIILGTVKTNSEEFGGRLPAPAPANLGNFEGLKAGFKSPLSIINDSAFKAGKAYKHSKLSTMIMSREFHTPYYSSTGIIFNTLYPGCVADNELLRDTSVLFQNISIRFQKNITKEYVSQKVSGDS
jgi:protochlorophyllide reductase